MLTKCTRYQDPTRRGTNRLHPRKVVAAAGGEVQIHSGFRTCMCMHLEFRDGFDWLYCQPLDTRGYHNVDEILRIL